jgi:hypothetical protein
MKIRRKGSSEQNREKARYMIWGMVMVVLTRGKSMIKIVETPAGRQYGSASEKEAEESEEKLVDKKEKKRIRSSILNKITIVNTKIMGKLDMKLSRVRAI